MEYMDHGSLHDVIHNDTLYLEPKQLLDILQDIVQGIRYLHLSVPQVIHGDLRSHNVLVDGRLRAKVSDFCNSLRTSREMGDGGFTGTPFWMAVSPSCTCTTQLSESLQCNLSHLSVFVCSLAGITSWRK